MIIGNVFSQDKKEGSKYSYVGTKKCKMCHLDQFKSWSTTRMALAYDLLKAGVKADEKKKAGLDPKKDYTNSSECLPCHVTGYGKPGGFTSIDKTPELAGVSCEMCHGAGSEYTKEQFMSLKNKEYSRAEVLKVGLVSPVTGDRCTSLCHNAKSPFYDKNKPFDFNKRKAEGTHKHLPLKFKHG